MGQQSICGIYKITSPSNKVYIGQSRDIESRWYKYKILNCKWQPYLYNSLKKHGVENHVFEIIHRCEEAELDLFESYYIKLFNCFDSDHGMNLRSGGGRNERLSECSKVKMGESLKTNWAERKKNGTHRQSIETVTKRVDSLKATIKHKKELGTNYKHTDEHKAKIGIKAKMYQEKIKQTPEYYSDEQVIKRKEAAKKCLLTKIINGTDRGFTKSGDSMLGSLNPFYGKKHSPEVLEKIAQSRKITWDKKMADGYKQSEEHVAKRVKKQLGQKRTPQHIENIKKGREAKMTEERKVEIFKKQSEAQKLVWENKKSNGFYSEESKAKRTITANKIWEKRRQKQNL